MERNNIGTREREKVCMTGTGDGRMEQIEYMKRTFGRSRIERERKTNRERGREKEKGGEREADKLTE